MFSRVACAIGALLFRGVSCSVYVSFDDASASSMRAVGRASSGLVFSPNNAIAQGDGIWCSAGNHGASQIVSWTGYLESPVKAEGLTIYWAYSPGEYKILASSDGSNFEEIAGWAAAPQHNESYVQHIMFETASPVKVLTIFMRSAQPWGFFGMLSATLLAEVDSVMLVNGLASANGDLCMVVPSGAKPELAELVLEPCLTAIAAGDGRELFALGKDGSIQHLPSGRCLVLSDADAADGTLVVQDCLHATAANDGRSAWIYRQNKQLELAGLQGYCASALTSGVCVRECGEAMRADSAGDKFYFVPATMHDGGVAGHAQGVAELLAATTAHLGSVLASLSNTRAACGKMGAAETTQGDLVSAATSQSKAPASTDPVHVAIAAIGTEWGIDLPGVKHALSQAHILLA